MLVMANISDVANLAGVSRTTVSRVLNDYKPVNEKTRQKVIRAVETLNYRPSAIARGMRLQQTKSFAVFIPDFANLYYSELLNYLEKAARAKGYLAIICTTEMDPVWEKEYVDKLLQRQVDGIIFCWYRNVGGYESYLVDILKKVPVVVLDQPVENLPVTSIHSDGFQGMKDVTNYLIRKGHTRFAFMKSVDEESAIRYRYEGFLSALQDNGLSIDDDLIIQGGYSVESGYNAAKKLLETEKPFTALVTEDDLSAIGSIECFHEEHIRVPEQVAVTGFDNIVLSRFVTPRITTISQPIPAIAEKAVEEIVDAIESGKRQNKRIVFPVELIIRESTG